MFRSKKVNILFNKPYSFSVRMAKIDFFMNKKFVILRLSTNKTDVNDSLIYKYTFQTLQN